jgi:hypothetical protein
MNTKTILKGLVLGVCFVIYGFSATANDTITFKWQQMDTVSKKIFVKVPEGKNFTVAWDDGVVQSYSGGNGGSMVMLSHSYSSNNTYTVKIAATTGDCTIEYFACQNMRITELDVSKCLNLFELICSFNQINSLDVSKNKSLYKFDCSFNQINSLDLSGLALDNLNCSYNQISNLNLTSNSQIKTLNCSFNQIDSLNLTKHVNLEILNCSSNQINYLNLRPNAKLEFLNYSSNQIEHLDLSNNTMLYYIRCDTNFLPLSDLYAASQKIPEQYNKILGQQTLLHQTLCIGKAQFKKESVFNGTYTNYVVTKSGSPAPITDYTIDNGTITFNTLDDYTITMTNDAIVSDASYPAKVMANVTVRKANTDATLSNLIVSEGELTPEFDSSIFKYAVNVADDISFIIIEAIPTDSNATISGHTGMFNLQKGENTLVITVTAEDDKTKQNYTITVNRGKVGIDAITFTNHELRVFPNPTTGQLTIKNEQLTIENVEIYDIVGKKLSNFNFQLSTNEIDISHLANGMYFLKIDGKTFKIIKE